MTDRPKHPIFATLYDPLTEFLDANLFDQHREYLTEGVDGRVLDLGAGTGRQFPFFEDATEDGTDLSVHAIEPDPHMLARAADRAATLDLDPTLVSATADELPYDDHAFDYVIASVVLCTIPDVDATLSEISRVLKPGGEFRFFEHVRQDGWRGTLQDLLTPLWRPVAGGCHLNRETGEQLANSPLFETVELQRVPVGITPVRPFVRGRLVA
jgi:ubiquinone/menaquinone biosynthesis C-methylase UbiE